MIEQNIYKIGEASARLGLLDKNSNTLRSWTEEFGEFLSQTANPEAGQPRRYTERDMQVLIAVRDYRTRHLSYDEIRDRLRAGEHDVTGVGAQQPREEAPHGWSGEVPYAAGTASLVPLSQIETLLAPLAASAEEWRRLAEEYRARLEAREARIETLEQRLDDLSTRLTVTAVVAPPTGTVAEQSPPLPDEPAPAPGAPADRTAHAALEDNVAGTVTGAASDPAPGGDPVAAPVAAAPEGETIFPLPAAPRSQHGEAAAPSPRRAWWQVWR